MTTAHRPTFNPARGGSGRAEGDLSKLSQQYSSKDMPSHKTMKYRQTGQGTAEELRRRDLRRELEDKERSSRDKKRTDGSSSSKRPRMDEIEPAAIDADEYEERSDGSDSDSDDEDDTAALMLELAKIKKERAAEKEKKDEVEEREKEKIRKEQILSGNPLLNLGGNSGEEGFKVKRRWDDDVVFKNCAKGQEDKKKEATFINDAIRSEFHRKFMDKYIK